MLRTLGIGVVLEALKKEAGDAKTKMIAVGCGQERTRSAAFVLFFKLLLHILDLLIKATSSTEEEKLQSLSELGCLRLDTHTSELKRIRNEMDAAMQQRKPDHGASEGHKPQGAFKADRDGRFLCAIQCFSMGDDFATGLGKLSETPRECRQTFELPQHEEEEEEEEEQESLRQNRRSTTTAAAGGEQGVGGGEQQEEEDDAALSKDEVIYEKVVDVSNAHDADDSMRETVGTPSTNGLQQAATAFTAAQPSSTTPASASAATRSLSSISPGGDACWCWHRECCHRRRQRKLLVLLVLAHAQAALLSVDTNESTADYHFPENQVDSEYPHPRTELTLSPDKCGAISRDPNVKCWWVKPGTSMFMRLKQNMNSRHPGALLRP